jgi:hypothetical protein
MTVRNAKILNNDNKWIHAQAGGREEGVCAGASLTWLTHAMNGDYVYDPHSEEGNPSNLELS